MALFPILRLIGCVETALPSIRNYMPRTLLPILPLIILQRDLLAAAPFRLIRLSCSFGGSATNMDSPTLADFATNLDLFQKELKTHLDQVLQKVSEVSSRTDVLATTVERIEQKVDNHASKNELDADNCGSSEYTGGTDATDKSLLRLQSIEDKVDILSKDLQNKIDLTQATMDNLCTVNNDTFVKIDTRIEVLQTMISEVKSCIFDSAKSYSGGLQEVRQELLDILTRLGENVASVKPADSSEHLSLLKKAHQTLGNMYTSSVAAQEDLQHSQNMQTKFYEDVMHHLKKIGVVIESLKNVDNSLHVSIPKDSNLLPATNRSATTTMDPPISIPAASLDGRDTRLRHPSVCWEKKRHTKYCNRYISREDLQSSHFNGYAWCNPDSTLASIGSTNLHHRWNLGTHITGPLGLPGNSWRAYFTKMKSWAFACVDCGAFVEFTLEKSVAAQASAICVTDNEIARFCNFNFVPHIVPQPNDIYATTEGEVSSEEFINTQTPAIKYNVDNKGLQSDWSKASVTVATQPRANAEPDLAPPGLSSTNTSDTDSAPSGHVDNLATRKIFNPFGKIKEEDVAAGQ